VEARELDAAGGRGPIVTTAKDAVKLAVQACLEADLWVLEQTVTFESGRAWVLRALEEVVT
jgi:tetraacyldisaccharide-1-P 4'-kinase